MPSPLPPHHFAHYFEAKAGRDHLLQYSIHLVHTPLTSFLTILNMYMVDNHDNCCGFLKKHRWMCTTDNQQCLCCYKDKRHWSNLHCQWWQGMTLCKLAFSVRAIKILAVASERGYSDFVCACFVVQSTWGAKLKTSPEDTQYGGRKKYQPEG